MNTLHENCLNTKLFLAVYFCIRAAYRYILCKFGKIPQENPDSMHSNRSDIPKDDFDRIISAHVYKNICLFIYRIYSNKRRISNNPRLLISVAALGIYIEISASL